MPTCDVYISARISAWARVGLAALTFALVPGAPTAEIYACRTAEGAPILLSGPPGAGPPCEAVADPAAALAEPRADDVEARLDALSRRLDAQAREIDRLRVALSRTLGELPALRRPNPEPRALQEIETRERVRELRGDVGSRLDQLSRERRQVDPLR